MPRAGSAGPSERARAVAHPRATRHAGRGRTLPRPAIRVTFSAAPRRTLCRGRGAPSRPRSERSEKGHRDGNPRGRANARDRHAWPYSMARAAPRPDRGGLALRFDGVGQGPGHPQGGPLLREARHSRARLSSGPRLVHGARRRVAHRHRALDPPCVRPPHDQHGRRHPHREARRPPRPARPRRLRRVHVPLRARHDRHHRSRRGVGRRAARAEALPGERRLDDPRGRAHQPSFERTAAPTTSAMWRCSSTSGW